MRAAACRGGAGFDAGTAVATAADGSVYISGTTTSFGTSSSLFVVKFNPAGRLVRQQIFDGAEGAALAVGSDGSVYAAPTTARDQIGDFDLLALQSTPAGDRRRRPGAEVRDGGAGGADREAQRGWKSVVRRAFAGRNTETAAGVAVAPDDGSVYVPGTTTVWAPDSRMRSSCTCKRPARNCSTRDMERTVSGNTVVVGASNNAGPPYSMLAAAAKLTAPRGTLPAAAGVLVAPTRPRLESCGGRRGAKRKHDLRRQ